MWSPHVTIPFHNVPPGMVCLRGKKLTVESRLASLPPVVETFGSHVAIQKTQYNVHMKHEFWGNIALYSRCSFHEPPESEFPMGTSHWSLLLAFLAHCLDVELVCGMSVRAPDQNRTLGHNPGPEERRSRMPSNRFDLKQLASGRARRQSTVSQSLGTARAGGSSNRNLRLLDENDNYFDPYETPNSLKPHVFNGI
ncbi:hypothetical protein ACRALDRAFT_213113 [Sodiomyces alcalophilus JCM 7366]|uniref:uncharacterized protein n=1 Tax=Sodiomyces alcalophilus JCM 7366 TaxID=591952 RepID=UPI0039B565EF